MRRDADALKVSEDFHNLDAAALWSPDAIVGEIAALRQELSLVERELPTAEPDYKTRAQRLFEDMSAGVKAVQDAMLQTTTVLCEAMNFLGESDEATSLKKKSAVATGNEVESKASSRPSATSGGGGPIRWVRDFIKQLEGVHQSLQLKAATAKRKKNGNGSKEGEAATPKTDTRTRRGQTKEQKWRWLAFHMSPEAAVSRRGEHKVRRLRAASRSAGTPSRRTTGEMSRSLLSSPPSALSLSPSPTHYAPSLPQRAIPYGSVLDELKLNRSLRHSLKHVSPKVSSLVSRMRKQRSNSPVPSPHGSKGV